MGAKTLSPQLMCRPVGDAIAAVFHTDHRIESGKLRLILRLVW
jgi:hypothetical protein